MYITLHTYRTPTTDTITRLRFVFLIVPLAFLVGCLPANRPVMMQVNPVHNQIPPDEVLFNDGRYMIVKSADGIVRVLDIQNSEILLEQRGTLPASMAGLSSPGSHRPNVGMKVEFNTNSDVLRPEAKQLLTKLGATLKRSKLTKKSVFIKGHADSDGTNAANMALSLGRALAVKKYLIKHANIPAQSLRIVGYGESMPLVDNSTEAKKQINRRVEIQTIQ